MATEEYSIGYSEGYQEGWNAAMDSTPPAAPVQEPVVWTATRLWNRKELWTCPADIERDLLEVYTTPPAAQREWVGLTDTVEDVARAIEAKLKEKNT